MMSLYDLCMMRDWKVKSQSPWEKDLEYLAGARKNTASCTAASRYFIYFMIKIPYKLHCSYILDLV